MVVSFFVVVFCFVLDFFWCYWLVWVFGFFFACESFVCFFKKTIMDFENKVFWWL